MAKGVAVAGASLLSLMAFGCHVNEPPPFDARAYGSNDLVGAAAIRAAPQIPLPTTNPAYAPQTKPAMPVTGQQGQPVYLSLREIMHRAAANSNEVRVAGYDPAVAETRVTENAAHYDPIFYSNLRYDKQFDRTPGTVIPSPSNPSSTITIDVENNNIYTAEAGLKQYLPSGGQVQLGYQFQNSDYSPVRYTRNNYWDSELKLQLTQPLLREFGYEVNWARITVARNDQRVSLLDYRKALEDNTEEIEKDYWQLYEAQRELHISEDVLQHARELADVLWNQFTFGGKATILELSQAASSVSNREATLLRARARVADISDDLKRRMSDPEFAIAGPLEIRPADVPIDTPIKFDVQDQIETAFANRLELGQQQIRINSADVARQVAINGLFPKLDFVGQVTIQGLQGNFDQAINDQWGGGHLVYSLGLQLEIPLGNREATAILRRSELQRQQAVLAYRQLQDKVSQDVVSACREVTVAFEAIRTSRTARMELEDVLNALNRRQASGQQEIDPNFVNLKLQTQEQLGDAQRTEANEMANYNIALSSLERAKGTILRYNNIMMEEEVLPWDVPSH
jgi:outer membrane protein